MKTMILKVGVLALLFAGSCSKMNEGDGAKTKQIATDVGQGRAMLYWTEAPFVFQGLCEEGGPLLASNCKQGVRFMDYDAFKLDLERSLSSSIATMKIGIADAQQGIKQTAVKISIVKGQLESDGSKLEVSEAEQLILKDEIRRFEAFAEEYEAQIGLIGAALTMHAPGFKQHNEDLAILSGILSNELNVLRKDLHGRCKELNAVITRIQSLVAAISGGEQQLGQLSVSLSSMSAKIQAQQTELAQMEYDFGFYGETVSNLESGIIYRVTDTVAWFGADGSEELFGEIKPFVRRFEEIFATQASH